MKTGTLMTPLHGGAAPSRLFGRMTVLAREIVSAIILEFGAGELLLKLSYPLWFQALGYAIGFDRHSSGVTTTTCGAIKEGIRGMEADLGFFACGGFLTCAPACVSPRP